MKLTSATLALFLSASLVGQTTIKEFNYVTKGIEVAINSGLDMKDGYELRHISKTILKDAYTNWSNEDRNEEVAFHLLMREDNTVASYILTHAGSVGTHDFTQVLCIPTGKTDLSIMNMAKEQFFNDSDYKPETDAARYWAFIELMIPYLDMVDWMTVEYENWIEFE